MPGLLMLSVGLSVGGKGTQTAPRSTDRYSAPSLVISKDLSGMVTWEKQVLLARGFKRVGRHSEYAI
jgi:hypothetical protein